MSAWPENGSARTSRKTKIETDENWFRVGTKMRCAERMSSTEITHDIPKGERHSEAKTKKPSLLCFLEKAETF